MAGWGDRRGEGQSHGEDRAAPMPLRPLQTPSPLHCSLFYSLWSPKPSQTSIQADAFSSPESAQEENHSLSQR